MSEKKGFDNEFVKDFSFDLEFDEQKLKHFLRKANMPLDLVPEEAMHELGCGKLVEGEFLINNAGQLLFSREPQRRLRHAYITCVRYQGNSMVSAIDRKDLQGDLISLVDETEAFVKRHTRLAFKIDGFKRIDVEEYPYEAIREAIVNAVCHRDYSLENNIFVNVFDNRIEVISPGNIPNNLTLNKVEGKSVPRNILITELFRKIGYIEKLGTGLKRMGELMLFHGLKMPQFSVTNAYFEVIFDGPGDKILELARSSKATDLREQDLNERQIRSLEWIQERKTVKRLDYQERFKISKRTAVRELLALVKNNLLEMRGDSKSTTYSLNQ